MADSPHCPDSKTYIERSTASTVSENKRIRFALKISADQYLSYYQGVSRRISTISVDGLRIEFPAQNIQRFLTRDGIQGMFEMELSPENKFIGIKKIN